MATERFAAWWSQEEDDQLVSLWTRGYEAKEIALQMGRTQKGVNHRIQTLRRNGRKVPRRYCKGSTLRTIERRSCHPFVRFLVKEMTKQRATWSDIALRSGVNEDAMLNWIQRTTPRLDNIQAALGALGYELRISPIQELSTGDLTEEPLKNAA